MAKPTLIEKEATIDIVGVELFEITNKKEKSITINEKFVDELIETHNTKKEEKGYLPTVFVGHNNPGRDEKPILGFVDNIRRTGKKVLADFVDMRRFAKWDLRSFPYRSVEIFGKQLTGVALLGSNPPHFENSPLMFSKDDDGNERLEHFSSIDLGMEDPTKPDTKEKPLSSNDDNMSDFAKEKAEMEANFAKEKADLEAKYAADLKAADEEKAQMQKELDEKRATETFAKCDAQVSEYFKKNEKLNTPNDEAKEAIAKFAASLDEEGQKAFFSILDSIVVFDADGEQGSGDAPEDGAETPAETDTAKADDKAAEYQKDGMSAKDAIKKAYAEFGLDPSTGEKLKKD